MFLGFESPPLVPAWAVLTALVVAPAPAAALGSVTLSPPLGLPSMLLVAVSESGSGRNTLSFRPKQPMSNSAQRHERAFTDMDDILRHDLKAMSTHFK